MKRNHFRLAFVIIVTYTMFGLVPIAKTGGACNGGLAYVVLGPIILGIAIIQYLNFRKLMKIKEKQSWLGSISSLICFLFWAFWTYAFSVDDPILGIVCFSPFLLLNLFIVALSFKRDLVVNS